MIDIPLLSKALTFYETEGFQPVQVPYVVDEGVSALTRPEGRGELWHDSQRVYAASAEQGFIQVLDTLLPGKYMALTPCYRDEPVLDALHYKVFLKLELAVIQGQKSDVNWMLDVAQRFFLDVCDIPTERVQIDSDQVDLVCRTSGIELGSYGIRRGLQDTLVYGTGFAEPRTSFVRNLLRAEYLSGS